jgi:hypothetical protein
VVENRVEDALMAMIQNPEDPTGVEWDGNGDPPVRPRMRKASAALQMRLAGATWAEIAMALGYPTPRAALVAVELALEDELHETDQRAKLRQMASLRLDRLLRSVWPKAIDPENPEHLLAVTKAREVISTFTKLHGLDAPSEVIVHNPTAEAIETWVAHAISLGLPDVEEDDVLELESSDLDEEPVVIFIEEEPGAASAG